MAETTLGSEAHLTFKGNLEEGRHGWLRLTPAYSVHLVERLLSESAAGDAVDMESVWVLAAAWQHGVRTMAVRAVSDAADSDLPLDFNRVFTERGEVSIPKVVGQLIRRPGRLPGLLRLANESEQAASALGHFLDAYLLRMEVGPTPELAKAEELAV